MRAMKGNLSVVLQNLGETGNFPWAFLNDALGHLSEALDLAYQGQ